MNINILEYLEGSILRLILSLPRVNILPSPVYFSSQHIAYNPKTPSCTRVDRYTFQQTPPPPPPTRFPNSLRADFGYGEKLRTSFDGLHAHSEADNEPIGALSFLRTNRVVALCRCVCALVVCPPTPATRLATL